MDDATRAALERITLLAKSRKIGVAGRFMPDRGVSALLASLGIAENVEEPDFFQLRTVVTPYSGITARQRRDWQEATIHRGPDVAAGPPGAGSAGIAENGRRAGRWSSAATRMRRVWRFPAETRAQPSCKIPRTRPGWSSRPLSARSARRLYHHAACRGSRNNSGCVGGTRESPFWTPFLRR